MAIEKTPRLGLKKYTLGSDLHPNRTEFNALQDLLESLVAISAQGTLSERPPAGVRNRFYWATDTARPYFDDGKQWLDVNPNGGGGAGQAVVVAGAATEGTSARAARADHTHNLALATASINGAMAKADKAKLDAATSNSTANTLALRNASGQVSVGTPTAATHAAHKDYVDGQIDTRAAAAHSHNADDVNAGVLDPARLPSATRLLQGALSAADKAKLDAATSGTTGGTLVQRADNGQFQLPAPTTGSHAANKAYVDAVAAERLEFKGDLGAGNINATAAPGIYVQASSTPVTPANSYPLNGSAGHLVVLPFSGGATPGFVTQEWTQWSPLRRFMRATNNAGTTWTAWTEQANTDTATSAADGLMSKADKAKLDGATSTNTAGSIVTRASNGRTNLSSLALSTAPSSADDATRKDYVDGQISTRAPLNHTHPLADIELHTLGQAQDLNEVLTRGNYHQGGNVYASLALNYPVALAGLLEVQASGTSFIYQRYTSYGNSNRVYTRARYSNVWSAWKESSTTDHVHNGSDITTGTVHPDRIANATSVLDGLMPKGDKAKLDAASMGSTAGVIAMRDANGNLNTATPTATTHAANKAYVDAEVGKKANSSHSHGAADLPDASATAPGIMSAADKKKLDTASSAATANSLVMLDAAGRTRVTNPAVAADAANKGYVDAEVAKKANASHSHGADDLSPGPLSMTHLRLSSTTDASETSTGHAFQVGADTANNVIIDNNEVIGRLNGAYTPIAMPSGINALPVPTTASMATPKSYVDGLISGLESGKANAAHNHSGANITSGIIPPARIANATGTLDGLMSAEDKTKLNKSNPGNYPGTLVERNSNGVIAIGDATAADHAANKRYVDGAIASEVTNRGVKSRWTNAVNVPSNNGALSGFVLSTITIPDPGYPYHVQASATIEAAVPAGTRWDLVLVCNGVAIDFDRGDINGPIYKVSGGTGTARTGPLTMQLHCNKQFGTGAFAPGGNRYFNAIMMPAHKDE